MLSERLIRKLLDDRQRSVTVPFRAVSFRDGSKPTANKCHENVARWIYENPADQVVQGWLVTSDFLFDKHSVVMNGAGLLFDITLLAYNPPFIRHPGTKEEYEQIEQAQLVLTQYANLNQIK